MNRELDAEIAEKVMGWTECFKGIEAVENADTTQEFFAEIVTGKNREGKWERLPYFSTNLDDAWWVVSEMSIRGFRYVVRGYWEGENKHYAAFDDNYVADSNPLFKAGPCERPAEAICRAALKAVAREVTA
jgi:hypothetical protein